MESQIRPAPIAWVIGFASAAIAAIMVYLLHHFVQGLYFAQIRERLEGEMSTISATESLLSSPEYQIFLPPKNKRLRLLVEFATLIERRKFDEAQKNLDPALFERDFDLAPIQKALDEVQAMKDNVAKAKQAKVKAEDHLRAFDLEFTKLQNDLRMALKLPVPTNADEGRRPDSEKENETSPMESFESGFLEGLPVIPEIIDGLADKEALINYLNTTAFASGEKKLKAEDLNDSIQKTLNGLKEQMASLLKDYDEGEKALEEAEKTSNEMRDREASSITAALTNIRLQLLEVAKPDISERTVLLYRRISQLLRLIHIEVPLL